MKPQQRARTVSARPRSRREESPGEENEEGLSLDPEQLGQRFLDYATGNSLPRRDSVPELQVTGEPASDAPVDGSHFSTGASTWENTVDAALDQGDEDDIAGQAMPYERGEDDEEREPERGVAEVDLTASVIKEASLLDEESSVLGETVPKEPRTDDTGSGARRDQREDESG